MTHDPNLDELHDRLDDLLQNDARLLVRVVDVQPATDGSSQPGTAAVGVMSCGMTPLQALSVMAGLLPDIVAQVGAQLREEHLVGHLRDDLERGVDALLDPGTMGPDPAAPGREDDPR